MTKNRILATGLILTLFAAVASTACHAEGMEHQEADAAEPTILGDVRGWVSLGAFIPYISSSVRLESNILGSGTDINLEDDLGLDDTMTQFSIQAGYYITPRIRLTAEYFELNRRASETLTRDISWGDEEFEIGMTVGTFFDVEVYRIAIGYDFIRNEDTLLGLAIGTHALDSAVGIGLILASEGGKIDVGTDASSSGLFPIPNVGGYWMHQLSDKWLLNSRLDWFGVSFGEWDGDLLSASVGVQYFFTRNFSASLSADYFNLKVQYSQPSWRGAAKLEYYGPKLHLSYSF